ncbi:hypothetical protein [Massilia sp. Dwa41.01b]|nr:hypothetical protein [Massilia sp. Dwa41.01b]
MATPGYVLVTRPRWHPSVTDIDAAAHGALAALAAGATLGDALDAAFALDEAFDLGARLREWLALGVFLRSDLTPT